eukprot:Hpha_TRINITY_DN14982_c4_g10::TRINITY_DN14982_c4_g10_i1::g.143371::m.143371/K07963/TRIM23, ARFD1; tripartite motif-containing protein 23
MPAALTALVCSGCGCAYEPPASKGEPQTEAMAGRVPRLLPCGHNVCTACATMSASSNDLPLPLHTLSAPPGVAPREPRVAAVACPCGCPPAPVGELGAEGLPVDIAVAEAVAEGGDEEPERLCDECETELATLWCESCQSEFCPECLATVHAPRVMQKHKAVPLSEKPPPADMCPTHPRQERTMFCSTCTTKVCALCCDERFGGAHIGEGHTVVPLEQAAASAVDRLKSQLRKLEQHKQKLSASAQRAGVTVAGIAPSQEATVEAITLHFADLRKQLSAALDQREGDLRREAEAVAQGKTQRLQARISELGDALSRVTRACSVCEVKLRGNSVDILDAQASFARVLGDAARAALAAGSSGEGSQIDTAGVPLHLDSALSRECCALVMTHGSVGKGEGPRITAVTAGESGPRLVPVSAEDEVRAHRARTGAPLSRNRQPQQQRRSRHPLLAESGLVPSSTLPPPVRKGSRGDLHTVRRAPPAVTTQGDQRGITSAPGILERRFSAPEPLLRSMMETAEAHEAPVGLDVLRSVAVP